MKEIRHLRQLKRKKERKKEILTKKWHLLQKDQCADTTLLNSQFHMMICDFSFTVFLLQHN